MRFALSRPMEKCVVNEMMAAHKNALVLTNIRQKSRLLQTVNEMMAAHKNAVVIANIRQKNQPLVVPKPVGRLRIFDTETTGLGTWGLSRSFPAVLPLRSLHK